MEFPKMIYLGGEHGAEHRIVDSQSEQDGAKADGFLPFGEHFKAPETAIQVGPAVEQIAAASEPNAETVATAEPPSDAQLAPSAPVPPVDEKAELISALTAAGKKFDKRWGIDKLRATLEATP